MGNKTYIIAAGGTSGHINPAIAIADEIRKNEPGSKILFCGTRNGLENMIVPNHGYELLHIDAAGFPKKLSKQLFIAISAFLKGRSQSREIIKKYTPDAVIGTGGYVCGPMVYMASRMGVPTLLHEQNAFPGKANRFLSRYVDVVCISFPVAREALKKAKEIILTGNPIREAFFGLTKSKARKELGMDPDEKILFATGGSLGARTINQTIIDLMKNNKDPGFRIILVCGKTAYSSLEEEAKKYFPALVLKEYLFDQHLYLAAADIVLCRAGAVTCSEIAILSKASIMVPYPYATNDHQTFNARTFSDIGASILIPDSDMNGELLHRQIVSLICDPLKIAKMEKLAGTLALPDATPMIYRELVKIAGKKN